MLREGGVETARFELLGRLGDGGYGVVHEALDLKTNQRVAVKQLGNTSAEALARFKREFRALADCHHPNLVGLKELIEQRGSWLIVMELVEGSDLLTYVRTAANDNTLGSYDEQKLRGALIGMTEGLRALHAFGILHRDLKPSNVLVRPDGRAVLLDFGLATSIAGAQESTQGTAVGTVRYMAPEQVAAKGVGTAADLYALGVCLFEALTGRAPFEGTSAIQILLAKQQQAAPRASSLIAQVPRDLDLLCARLLATEPAERPSTDEVLDILSRGRHSVRPLPQPSIAPRELFAGREAELEHLERALARTDRGELRIVLIEGESGVGKSELVAEFLRRMQQRAPTSVALRGRCYENEQVSYKAFDGCVDELARLLARLPEEESAALLPVRAALLGQLFPVLREVPALAHASREGVSADPTARRLEAFGALAALLGKLAEERPVVLVVDDLQWSDAESFRLLSALATRPDRPPVLLLATVRPREELEPEVLAQVEAVRRWKHTDVVQLFGLPRAQAKLLAAKLLRGEAPEAWLAMIADESDGHPLFVSELVQFASTHDFGARARITLDAALRARVARLDTRERDLLELVALAGRPHGAHVFARALALPEVEEAARTLLSSRLLRLRKGQELGCHHDRIRRTVVELIAHGRLPRLHRQLAAALSQLPDGDAAEQARHWDLAGEPDAAIAAYEQAVQRAIETLAFARAGQLCARALSLLGDTRDERQQRLTVQRAYALACSGRSGEAAALYAEASARAEGEQSIRLRSREAQQLMLSGKITAGYAAARALLAELGLEVPATVWGSLLRFGTDMIWLWLEEKRLVFRGRAKPGHEARRALMFEIVDELLYVIGLGHPIGAVTVWTRSTRLVTDADESQMMRAYAARGWLASARRSLASALPYFEQSRLRLREAAPSDVAFQAYAEGSARLASWDWVGGAPCLERAQRVLQERLPDQPWQVTLVRYHLGICWYNLGEHERLSREMESWLAESRERNDVLGTALLLGMGMGFYRHLLHDAPEAAVQELDAAMLPIPNETFSFAHFGHFAAKGIALVYQGGTEALSWLDSVERAHGRDVLLRVRMGQDVLMILRAIAALRAYTAVGEERRRTLLALASKLARRLTRRSSPFTHGYATLLLAQIACLEGRTSDALHDARTAHGQLEGLRHVNARAASYLIGLLEGGQGGRAKQSAALEAYRREGFRDPLRTLCVALPLLPALDDARATTAGVDPLVLGRYELLDALAVGASSSVVAARDVHSGELVALKELARPRGTSLERFKQEFRALRDVHHESLARIDALFEHEGRWVLSLELVQGSDLIAYTRPNGACDPERLRASFAGLTRALVALHDAGFVHRDVTPANVRVTASGRTVLLDFGLIARRGQPGEELPVGTAAYAAPEQLEGAMPAASADVYGLGSCLYEALYGRLPFSAAPGARTVAEKRELAPSFPEVGELDPIARLCARMLAPAPRARPPLRAVLALLEDQAGRLSEASELGVPDATAEPASERFAGRDDELCRLLEAFERTCEDGLTFAFVEGESGVGKSTLVSEFARRARANWPGLEVLASRCYENEQVAFKAFDGAVDRLAQLLRKLPNTRCEALLPKRAALLGQLFPVLTSVPAIAQATRKGLPADPAAQKLAARECFLQLLENLSARLELLFVIDDLQWADPESFALLRALCARGPRLPLLIVCTTRPRSEIDEAVEREIARFRELSGSERIALTGLTESASAALAVALHGAPLTPARIAALVRESKGHPLFLRELVGYQRSDGTHPRHEGVTLDQALRARVESFEGDARLLLRLSALAGRPQRMHVFARAMQRNELPRDAVIALLGHGLLCRRGEQELACYHDRIRAAVLATLSSDEQRALSSQLAGALDGESGADLGECARLWQAAGARDRAATAYEQAGDHALAGLAFQRAAEHYQCALTLLEAESTSGRDARCQRLLVALGHALACAGQSAEAVTAYERAAEQAQGEEQVRLRIAIAQHLIQSAQPAAGMRAASDLLRSLGLSLPASERASLARIAWERSLAALRGTDLRGGGAPPSAAARLQLEALHGLSSPVRAISYAPGSALVVQYSRRAIAAGEPRHAARALALEGVWRALRSPDDRRSNLLDRSRVLADGVGDPALIAEVELARGIACLASGEYALAPRHVAEAHELLASRCPGEPWLLTSTRMHLGSAWFYSGDMRSILRHGGDWLEEARARGDRYGLAALSGFGFASVRHLLHDRPEAALEELAEAMRPWPDEPFSTTHFGALITTAMVHGYRGGGALLDYLERNRASFERPFLMRTPSGRLAYATLRSGGLLLQLDSLHDRRAPEVVRRLRDELASLRSHRSETALGIGTLYGGVIALIEGDKGSALTAISAAQATLARRGHYLAVGAQYLVGSLEGGAGGRAKRESVLATLRAEGWKDTARALALRTPAAYLVD